MAPGIAIPPGGVGAFGVDGAVDEFDPIATWAALEDAVDDDAGECVAERPRAASGPLLLPMFGFTSKKIAAPMTATDPPIPSQRRASACFARSFWPHRLHDGGPGSGPQMSLMLAVPHSRQLRRIHPWK